MEVSGQRHAPAALYPQEKDPRYPLYRRLGGPQSRSGHRGYRKNLLASAGDRTSTAVVFLIDNVLNITGMDLTQNICGSWN
jgi:hypothetical protein